LAPKIISRESSPQIRSGNQDVNALEGRHLTEEGEAAAALLRAGQRARRRRRVERQAVLDDEQPVGRQSPVGIALRQEGARRDIGVGKLQHRTHEAFPLQEARRRDIGEAGVAVGRRGTAAKLRALGLHHLAVVVADRQELVERHDDRRIRQRFAHGIERLETEAQHMVEMHDVRPEIADEADEVATDVVGVAVGQEEVVVVVAVEQDVGRALAQAHQRRPGMARRRRADPRQIDRAGAGQRVQPLVQIVRGDLGAAERKARMSVADDEDAQVFAHAATARTMVAIVSDQRVSKTARSMVRTWASQASRSACPSAPSMRTAGSQ
jgi:hypothetical protein